MNREEIIRKMQEAGLKAPARGDFIFIHWDQIAMLLDHERAAERERIRAANAPEIERCNAHIKALEDERAAMMQLFTDPENQPTQHGTVTVEYMQREIAAEREACAKVCEDDFGNGALNLADAIRARKD